MPHSFGCKATDWFRDIWSPCNRFCTWSQCCHFGWSFRCSDTLRCRSEQYTKDVLKRYVISTFCAVDQVDLLGGQFKALTRGKQGNAIHWRVGPSNNCRTEKLARFLER